MRKPYIRCKKKKIVVHTIMLIKALYLWRSEACINTTISFDVSCGTYRDPRIFFYRNEHLFEYEDGEEDKGKLGQSPDLLRNS
ncbi:hypothetical protein RB195_000157 [Necator americanus]|uniref:DUF7808 domain-containing protein n=1 Tax=Necator americanus TaxID=51031 RepID=A0ABR1D9E3_NECAM